ncbi:ComF family protein [Lysobacter sp. LF1]|uniref:ComF family protein n=1 Tax=Lysobacter stagni TaxID=3045172 RepID=A0ABT6XDL9_9GAMM|nr:ComF family protein [Lysobacter sp. LF1]MDI9238156.1 ComF family protein [Lysobacter sp. LF1]
MAHGVDSRDRFAWHRWLPTRCLICSERGSNGLDLCTNCREKLPYMHAACGRCAMPLPQPSPACGRCLRRPPPQTRAHAAFVYCAPLDRLLPRAKFHGDLAAIALLGRLTAQALADADRPQALVPLPLHAGRLRQRGYDQALELARPLSRWLHLPLRDDVLLRVRATSPQSRLDATARQRNLRQAFAVRPRAALPSHVALVDDVMTTGATVRSAAHALLRAGVSRVDVWVCARVP